MMHSSFTSAMPSAMDDSDPPHIISQEDTPTMSQSEEDALRSAVLSALSSSASTPPSGLASSGSASSSGFSSETPKISTPSGSSSAGLRPRPGDAEDVKALRDANASATHLLGHVITRSDPASWQDIDAEQDEQDTDTPVSPPNSLLDIMKRRYPADSAAAAPVPNAAMRIRSTKRRGQESLAVKAVTEDATMADPDQGSTPDLQSEHVPNLSPPAQNSHRNCTTKNSNNSQPTVQFSFLDSNAMPAENNTTTSSTGNVLQRACQMLQGYRANSGSSNMRTGNKYSSSSAQPPSQPQSPARIRPTKSILSAAAKTKRAGRRTDKKHQQGRQSKRLSLSEYRKADESSSVRLTDAQPHRSIHAEYDLTDSPHCRILGHGASSTVRLAVRRSDDTLVAVKCLSKYEIISSRRAGGRESIMSSPTRHRHRSSSGTRHHRRLDECEVLRALDGVPNVTHLLDVYEDNDEVQLVLEYCPGGELFDAIHHRRRQAAQEMGTIRSVKSAGSGYTEHEAASIIGQLLEALAALHERGIVHRDVKPENVFLMSTNTSSNDKIEDGEDGTVGTNDLEVRLSDFGLARYLHRPNHRYHQDADDVSSTASSSASGGESPITPQSVLRARGRAYSSVGSDFYAAPEVENGSGYDTQCDVYSLGVTLYILLGGFQPRQRSGSLDAYDTMQSILDSPMSSSEEESSSDEGEDSGNVNAIPVTFPGSHWKNVSSEAKDLIRKMMHSDPNVRVTAKVALQHEWIAQHFKTATASPTAKEQPSRAPRQKKRSSLVLTSTSDISAGSDDRPNFRRKLSKLNLCDMSNKGTPDVTTQSSPISDTTSATAAAVMPPPMSFDKAAFSMAELYNRMSLVADAAAEQVDDGDDEEIIENEGISGDTNPTPECTAATATVPLSV